jgi:hypothetical protein
MNDEVGCGMLWLGQTSQEVTGHQGLKDDREPPMSQEMGEIT